MRNIKMTDADAGTIHQLLLREVRGCEGNIREVERYEADGFKMVDGSPMNQQRVDSLNAQRERNRTNAVEWRRLADLFLGSD